MILFRFSRRWINFRFGIFIIVNYVIVRYGAYYAFVRDAGRIGIRNTVFFSIVEVVEFTVYTVNGVAAALKRAGLSIFLHIIGLALIDRSLMPVGWWGWDPGTLNPRTRSKPSVTCRRF